MYILTEIAIDMGAKKIALPVFAPKIIAENAKNRGVSVTECKSDKADIMRAMKSASKIQFRLNFDAPYSAVMLLQYLNEKGITLASMSEKIPDMFIQKSELPCSDTERTMRTLTENLRASGEKHVLSEGVKIIKKNGWVLIIPHSKNSAFRIISEGTSSEFAKELCDFGITELKKAEQ